MLSGDLVRSLTLDQGVTCIDVSDDGLRLATCCGRTCFIWDCHRFQLISRINRKPAAVHRKKIRLVRFTRVPSDIITVCNGHLIVLWRITAGQNPSAVQIMNGHRGTIFDCLFNEAGDILYSSSSDGRVLAWSWATGQQLSSNIVETCQIRSISLNTVFDRLACAMPNGAISVWDLANQDRLCAIEGDPEWVKSQSGTATRAAWVDAGKSHTGPVLCSAFSPNGALLATGAGDSTAKLWSALSLRSDQQAVDSQKSARKVASQTVELQESRDDSIEQTVNGTESPLTIGFSATVIYTFLHEAPVEKVAFTADSLFVISCARDCTVKVSDLFPALDIVNLTSFVQIWETTNGTQSFQVNLPVSAGDLHLSRGWSADNTIPYRLFVQIVNRVIVLDLVDSDRGHHQRESSPTAAEHVHKRVNQTGIKSQSWPPPSLSCHDNNVCLDIEQMMAKGLNRHDLKRAIAHRSLNANELLTLLQTQIVNEHDVRPSQLKTNLSRNGLDPVDVLRAISTTTNFRYEDVIMGLSRSGELGDRACAAVKQGGSLDNILLEMGFNMSNTTVLLHLQKGHLQTCFKLKPTTADSTVRNMALAYDDTSKATSAFIANEEVEHDGKTDEDGQRASLEINTQQERVESQNLPERNRKGLSSEGCRQGIVRQGPLKTGKMPPLTVPENPFDQSSI